MAPRTDDIRGCYRNMAWLTARFRSKLHCSQEDGDPFSATDPDTIRSVWLLLFVQLPNFQSPILLLHQAAVIASDKRHVPLTVYIEN